MSSTKSSTCCENSGEDEDIQDIHLEPSCDSLLMVLDDKNKIIATLKQQLQNQKVQLAYYLKRELTSPKVLQLSESCSPQASEESMAINLALNKFYKQMGIKSNVYSLYERMSIIDKKIDKSLQDQEFIVRKIVNKLCEFVKHSYNKTEFKIQFANFVSDPFHLDLFNELLNATLKLRQKLDTFSICCNRLMVIEEERNSIVEQIYSLPTEQRMNCNYLISTQMEKTQLENEIKLILKEQRKDRERIKDLNIIEEKLSTLQTQLNTSFTRNDETCRINKMLQKVNAEAKILLELTKEQRTRYEKEMLRVRQQKDFGLETMLVSIKIALGNRELSKKELIANGISSKEDMKIFECIKKEIDVAKERYISNILEELQMKRHECEGLKAKLNKVLLDRNQLRICAAQLQMEISNISFNQKNDLSSLKEERDTYKSQVEDLEAIREAYAQLVDRQPTKSKIEKEYMEQIYDRDKQIKELDKVNRNRSEELIKMKNIINMQTKELMVQGEIIEGLKEQHSGNIKDEIKSTRRVCKKTSNGDSGINSTPRESIFSGENVVFNLNNNDETSYNEVFEHEILLEEEIVNWIEEDELSLPLSFNTKFPKTEINSNYEEQAIQVVENIKNHKIEKSNLSENEMSFRCFKIVSKKQGKVSDVMEAVVKTNVEADLQSNIKMENDSSFSLEINYKPKQPITCAMIKDVKDEIDENELMKDCSRESLPIICQRKELTDVKYSRESLNKNFCSYDSSFTEQMTRRLEVLRELEINADTSSDEYVDQLYAYKSQSA